MIPSFGKIEKRRFPPFGRAAFGEPRLWRVVLALGFAVVFVAALAPQGARAAVGFVQTKSDFVGGTPNSHTFSLTQSSTSGNLLIISNTHDNTAVTISSITDSKGNTYRKAVGPVAWAVSAFRTEIWYAKNITGGGAAISITVTFTGNVSSFTLSYAEEYSGIDTVSPLDQTSFNTGTTGLSVDSGSKTTLFPNELIFGHGEGQGPLVSAGAGFTARNLAFGNTEEDKTVTSVGSYNAAFTLNQNGEYIAIMATFKAAVQGTEVSSRSDTLSDSRPSATSNHSVVFTTNTAIYGSSLSGSSTLILSFDPAFTIPAGMDCGDVDAATSSQFGFNWPACQATATAWGFSATGSVITLVPPSGTGVYVPTSTQVTIKLGSNATAQQQGDSWITNPSTAGTYTISVGGTFGGSGNMLVSILSGVTVEARVAEHLSVSVSSVAAVNCTADDGASVTQRVTTATTVDFGNISPNTFYQGCQDIEVSTNAGGGYVATVREESALRTGSGANIPDTSCDAGCDEITGGTWTNPANVGFGHTCRNQTNNDCNLEYGNGAKFRRFPSVVGGTAGLGVKVATGSYTGNGTARTISHGLGVAPKVIMLWLDEDDKVAGFVMRTNQHATASSIQFPTGTGNSRLAADMITAMDSTTFSLGTASSVNQTSSSYMWVAYAGNGVATGKYDGNAVDNRNIPHGMSAAPKMLFVWRDTDNTMEGLCARSERHSGDVSACFQLGTLPIVFAANQLQAMDGSNFQVGTESHVNANTISYKWFALAGPSVGTGSYTGNGQDNRDISHGLSATPSLTFIFPDDDGGTAMAVRSNQHTGSVSVNFGLGGNTTDRDVDMIKAMSTTSFRVGMSVFVNENSTPHQWFAVKSSSQFSEIAGETLMASSTPVRIAVGRVKYRLAIPGNQASGTYTTKVTYIVTPTY